MSAPAPVPNTTAVEGATLPSSGLRAELDELLKLQAAASAGPWVAHDGQRKFTMPGGEEQTVCACGAIDNREIPVAWAVGADDEDYTMGEGVDLPQKARNAAFIASIHRLTSLCERYDAALVAAQRDAVSVAVLTDPATIDRAARTMARMVYRFGHAERIAEYTSPEFQREHVKVAGYVIHAAVQVAVDAAAAKQEKP